MITTAYGCDGTIIADHGLHKARGYVGEVRLVTFERIGDKYQGYKFTFTLHADGGIHEVEAAADSAPKVPLSGAALRCALKDAM